MKFRVTRGDPPTQSRQVRDRRSLIFGLIGLASAAPLYWAASSHTVELLDRRRLMSILGLEGTDVEWLKRRPQVCRELARTLGRSQSRWRQLASRGTERALRARLRRSIDLDYASGRLTEVDGWLLSHTEALLLAILTGSDT